MLTREDLVLCGDEHVTDTATFKTLKAAGSFHDWFSQIKVHGMSTSTMGLALSVLMPSQGLFLFELAWG